MKRAVLSAAALCVACVWLWPAAVASADPGPKGSIDAFKKADLNNDGKIDVKEAVRAGWLAPPRRHGPPGEARRERHGRRHEAGPPRREGRGEHARRGHGKPKGREHARRGRRGPSRGEAGPGAVAKEKPQLFRRFVGSLNPMQQRMFLALTPPDKRAKLAEGLKKVNRMKLLASMNPMQRQLLMASSSPEERKRIGEALKHIDGRKRAMAGAMARRRAMAGKGHHPMAGRGHGMMRRGMAMGMGRPGAGPAARPGGPKRRGVCPRAGVRPERGQAPCASRREGRRGPGMAARPERPTPPAKRAERPTKAPKREAMGAHRGGPMRERMMEHVRNEVRKIVREELRKALQEIGKRRGRTRLQSYEGTPKLKAAPAVHRPANAEMLSNLDVLSDLKWLAPALDEMDREAGEAN